MNTEHKTSITYRGDRNCDHSGCQRPRFASLSKNVYRLYR
jgi:hypothetical protein